MGGVSTLVPTHAHIQQRRQRQYRVPVTSLTVGMQRQRSRDPAVNATPRPCSQHGSKSRDHQLDRSRDPAVTATPDRAVSTAASHVTSWTGSGHHCTNAVSNRYASTAKYSNSATDRVPTDKRHAYADQRQRVPHNVANNNEEQGTKRIS